MSSTTSPNLKYFPLVAIVVLTTAGAMATTWPSMRQAARSESNRLVGYARASEPAEAASFYSIAVRLDPANQAAYLGQARLQLAAGKPEVALSALDHAGEGSAAAELRVRMLIELGRNSQAADSAASLLATNHTDANIVLVGLAYALAGRSGDIPALIPRVTAPEAAQRLARAQAGQLPLAAELSASELPVSARALLVTQPVSFERNLLLGRLYYQAHTPADLVAATNYLSEAATLNPSDRSAHLLLANIYSQRGLTAESLAQTALVAQLDAGRP